MELSELIEKYGDCEVKEELLDMVVNLKGKLSMTSQEALDWSEDSNK